MADDAAAVEHEESPEGEERPPIETLGRDETRNVLYAMLFTTDRPLSASRMAEALGDADPEVVGNLLEELREWVDEQPGLPYTVRAIAGGYQLVTRPQYAPYIRSLFQQKKSKRLSKPVLETLAIVAYKQPVTRAEVESVRGVSVSHAFDQLQERRLVKVSGVADLPGRPKLFRTTDEFLALFGLNSLKDLPTLDELQSGD